MRLSTKLAIGLTLTSTIILGCYGVYQLRQEERDLRNTAEHDFRLLGTALQVAIENSVRDRQSADVRAILDALELRDSAVDVLVFDSAGQLQANSWGSSASVDLVRGSIAGVSASHRSEVRFEGPRRLGSLVGIFPLRGSEDVSLGAVAVVWPLDELRRDLRATAIATLVSSAILIFGIVGVGWLLALYLVRRPLRLLVGAMRDVEAGDWAIGLPSHGGDEVGAALAEFNAMVRELDHTRRQLVDAAESREALEVGLQRLDKLATVGQLSAGLAHEIGSPLQILNGRARDMAARDDLPADVRRTAGILEQQSDRIAKIVERLLGFARRRGAQIVEVDVRLPVASVVDLIAGEARRRGVSLQFHPGHDVLQIMADPDQIQQITANLLSNALRATPRGGRVLVSLGTVPAGGDEHVSTRPSVYLEVEDNGPGVPDDVRRRMFEPFFTTWPDQGGTGLGLTVVKAIVDEHGGAIDVDSRLGTGTRVRVLFPAAHQGAAMEVA